MTITKLQSEYPDLDKYEFDDEGIYYCKKNTDIIHNPYGPAYIYFDGKKEWVINGERHRLNGPAIEWPDGSQEYYLYDEHHRLDGPAIIHYHNNKESKEWWVNGKRHRLDGPAIIKYDGTKEYYVNNKLHRLDGPAFISPNYSSAWYIDGKFISNDKDEFYSKLKNFKNKQNNPQNKTDILNIKNAIQNNIDNTFLSLLKSLL